MLSLHFFILHRLWVVFTPFVVVLYFLFVGVFIAKNHKSTKKLMINEDFKEGEILHKYIVSGPPLMGGGGIFSGGFLEDYRGLCLCYILLR